MSRDRVPSVPQREFLDAQRDEVGWCKGCRAFTLNGVEAGSRPRTCPVCHQRRVIGAQAALTYGEFKLR